jgi:hypothetical protein
MRHSKGMGLGAMFVLLVIVIALLPMVVRFIERMTLPHFAIQGFQGGPNASPSGPNPMYSSGPSSADGGVAGIPAIGATSKLPTWRPDPNTDYLCRSPNEDGQPCPEGTFCDGLDQTCKPVYVGGPVPGVGYFS